MEQDFLTLLVSEIFTLEGEKGWFCSGILMSSEEAVL